MKIKRDLKDIKIDHSAYTDWLSNSYNMALGYVKEELTKHENGHIIKNIPDSYVGLYFVAAAELGIKLSVENHNFNILSSNLKIEK